MQEAMPGSERSEKPPADDEARLRGYIRLSKILGRLAWLVFGLTVLAFAGLSAYNYLFSGAAHRQTERGV